MHNTGLSVNSLVHKNYFKTKLGELILAIKPKDSSQKSLLSEIILKNQVFKILLALLFLRLTEAATGGVRHIHRKTPVQECLFYVNFAKFLGILFFTKHLRATDSGLTKYSQVWLIYTTENIRKHKCEQSR